MSTQSHISTNQQYNAFSVLVVDDELGMQAILKKALGKLFSQVDTAGSIEEAEELRNSRHYDLILLDINLPGRSGIEWEEAFEDDDLGASDFILKPFNLEQMLKAVSRCMDRRLNERMQYAMKRDYQRHNTSEIIGGSEKTRQLKQLITQFAPSRASVLVEGESGTGKELVARGIHQATIRPT